MVITERDRERDREGRDVQKKRENKKENKNSLFLWVGILPKEERSQ